MSNENLTCKDCEHYVSHYDERGIEFGECCYIAHIARYCVVEPSASITAVSPYDEPCKYFE